MTRRARKGKAGGARAGAGRKPLGEVARSASIPVKATAAQKSAFSTAAADVGLSLSAWMVEAGELAITRGSTR